MPLYDAVLSFYAFAVSVKFPADDDGRQRINGP